MQTFPQLYFKIFRNFTVIYSATLPCFIPQVYDLGRQNEPRLPSAHSPHQRRNFANRIADENLIRIRIDGSPWNS